MVAFSARRLVCSAIARISSTTAPIDWAEADRLRMLASVDTACAPAASVMASVLETCWLISWIEALSSSDPLATVCTFIAALPAAPATVPARCDVSSAARARSSAACATSREAAAKPEARAPIFASNSPARRTRSWRMRSAAERVASNSSRARWSAAVFRLSRKALTALPTAPISSSRLACGMAAS